MATRHVFKSCCGSKVLILELDKPVKKIHATALKQAGYSIPDNFFQSGVFYLQKTGLVATASYGAKRINIRCQGSDCDKKINELENVLQDIIK